MVLLEAQLANLVEDHDESENILEEGEHNAKVRQVKNRLKTLKQKELKLERSLSHRRRRNEDEVPRSIRSAAARCPSQAIAPAASAAATNIDANTST